MKVSELIATLQAAVAAHPELADSEQIGMGGEMLVVDTIWLHAEGLNLVFDNKANDPLQVVQGWSKLA